MIFGLVGRKKHEAALRELTARAEILRGAAQADLQVVRRTLAQRVAESKTQTEALVAAQASTKEALERLKIARIEKEEEEARSKAANERAMIAEAETARVCACHAGRVRVFVMPVDALEMTARARAVEGSLRCQWSADERAIICDSGRPLTEAEYNAVVAAICPVFNRT